MAPVSPPLISRTSWTISRRDRFDGFRKGKTFSNAAMSLRRLSLLPVSTAMSQEAVSLVTQNLDFHVLLVADHGPPKRSNPTTRRINS